MVDSYEKAYRVSKTELCPKCGSKLYLSISSPLLTCVNNEPWKKEPTCDYYKDYRKQ